MKLARMVKYGLIGGVFVGGVVVATAPCDEKKSHPLVRFTRAACTAVEIGNVYNRMLYSKELDQNSLEYQDRRSEAHKMGAKKLLALCVANKGAYIKVGQHIGALDYLLPDEYVHTMRVLHKNAPQNDVEQLYKVIKEELKIEPTELFLEFEKEPLGTASLAQVHKAKLRDENHTEVAVKVQHYYVKDNINMDLKWMEFLIYAMSKVFPEFKMQWLVDETKKNITKELNFLEEGRNCEKATQMFNNFKWLKLPKIFWEYSTERVLVMEYVSGGQINDLNYIEKHNIDKLEVCKKLGDLYSHMIFVSGFVHSDPHPGNILVRQDPGDKEVTVYLLDHGLYNQLTENFRYHYSNLWLSIIALDHKGMKTHSQAIGIDNKLYGLFACMVTGRPWESLIKGIDKIKPSENERRIFQNELPNFLSQITECLEKVDRQALLVLKTNDLIRSIQYALGVQNKMCGFLVMTKCCTKSVYQLEHKRASTQMQRQFLNIKYTWSLFLLYLYGWYLDIIHNYI